MEINLRSRRLDYSCVQCSRSVYALSIIHLHTYNLHMVHMVIRKHRTGTMNYTWKRKHLPLLYVFFFSPLPLLLLLSYYISYRQKMCEFLIDWTRHCKLGSFEWSILGGGHWNDVCARWHNPLPEWMDTTHGCSSCDELCYWHMVL